MSQRPAPGAERPRRNIMGPQSALTDFLASHNISARQIADEAARRREAAQTNQDGAADDQGNGPSDEPAPTTTPRANPRRASTRSNGNTEANDESEAHQNKRTRETQKAIDKIKASKKFKQRKRRRGKEDDSGDDEEIAHNIFKETLAPLPGQMENCAICGKRFTVTPYSRSAPDGGLLCTPCGKELDKENGAPKRKKAKAAGGGPVGRRRKVQSSILDGTYVRGAKTLSTLCIEKLANNIDLAEDLGDVSPFMVDRIARMLAKKRLLDPRTLDLFLQPKTEDIALYDAAKLSSDDFIRVFQTLPNLKSLKVRNAIHFKDEVMDYLISRETRLESLYLYGANLISEDKWHEYLQKKGQTLNTLKVYYTDRHFGNDTLALLPNTSPSLRRLKVSNNPKVDGAGVEHLAKLKSLQHLSLQLHCSVHPDVYIRVLGKVGRNLKTLSIARAPQLDNTVLDAIHGKCVSLVKLRITESQLMTDDGFARLFTDWSNPPLVFVDFQKNRHSDAAHPRQNPDKIGLCSDGFKALMAHSGNAIRQLNIHACRHISLEAFEEVFGPEKVYPELMDLEISFCEEVTDFVVGSIFRSCPNLRRLNVFGCMKVKDVMVPPGKILVGVPNAVGMQVEGDD